MAETKERDPLRPRKERDGARMHHYRGDQQRPGHTRDAVLLPLRLHLQASPPAETRQVIPAQSYLPAWECASRAEGGHSGQRESVSPSREHRLGNSGKLQGRVQRSNAWLSAGGRRVFWV